MSYRSKRLKSKFEKFFEIIHASQTAFCKLCQHKMVKIKMKNRNTSSLRKHLTSFHKKEIFLPVKPKLSEDIASFFVTAGRSGQSENSSDNITIATVDWVVKKYLPFSFFDDKATQVFDVFARIWCFLKGLHLEGKSMSDLRDPIESQGTTSTIII